MGQAFEVNGKVFKSYEEAARHCKTHKVDASGIVTTELTSDQVVRKGRIMQLNSAVHHQRHSPCIILVQMDEKGIPFRLTVTPVNHEYKPRRDVLPFDAFVDLGAHPKGESDRELSRQSFDLLTLFDMFSNWFDKCGLGVSPIEEPRLLLPMYMDMEQYEVMKQLHLDEFFSRPIRIMESIMAFTNDVDWMQGQDVRFGKDSYTQFCAKCRSEIDRSDRGAVRVDKIAKAYHYHLLTR